MAARYRNRLCGLCGVALTDKNRSQEHIIANAIGGKRRTSAFICDDCNERTGGEWDAQLARELLHLTLLVGIKRDRGRVPATRVGSADGRQFLMRQDGRLEVVGNPLTMMEADGRRTFEIRARSRAEAQQVLHGLKRKYPTLDVDAALADMELRLTPDPAMANLTISVANPGSRRALVKSLVAQAADNGLEVEGCDAALAYLRGETDVICQGFVHTIDPVIDRQTQTIFHCVSVFSLPGKGLLGYVELFSLYRILVVLSHSYTGPDVEPTTYAINVVNGQNIHIGLDRRALDVSLAGLQAGEFESPEAFQLVLNRAMEVIGKRAKQREFNAAFKTYFHTAMDAAGMRYGDRIEGEKAAIFTSVLSQCLAHHVMQAGWHGLAEDEVD